MEKIASFKINHDTLEKGIYISRIDNNVITYDIRMKLPNKGDYLTTAGAHTLEHLLATYLRNTGYKNEFVYIGPMGCRTGFYILTFDTLNAEDFIRLMQKAFEFICNFEGEIPGTAPWECGNYKDHNLNDAKIVAGDMCDILANYTTEKLKYKE